MTPIADIVKKAPVSVSMPVRMQVKEHSNGRPRVRRASGQALVETAIVLPIIILTLIICFQFLYYVRTKLVLGFSAMRIGQEAAAGGSPHVVAGIELEKHFIGRLSGGLPPVLNLSQEPLPAWRAYPGIHTLRPNASAVVVKLSFRFFPNFGIGGYWPPARARIELPMEQAVPNNGK